MAFSASSVSPWFKKDIHHPAGGARDSSGILPPPKSLRSRPNSI